MERRDICTCKHTANDNLKSLVTVGVFELASSIEQTAAHTTESKEVHNHGRGLHCPCFPIIFARYPSHLPSLTCLHSDC